MWRREELIKHNVKIRMIFEQMQIVKKKIIALFLYIQRFCLCFGHFYVFCRNDAGWWFISFWPYYWRIPLINSNDIISQKKSADFILMFYGGLMQNEPMLVFCSL